MRNWDLIGKWIEQFGKEIIYLQKSLVDAIYSHKAGGPLWHDHANLPGLLNIVHSDSNWLNKEETEFVMESYKMKNDHEQMREKHEN